MEELKDVYDSLFREELFVWDKVKQVILENPPLKLEGKLLQLSIYRCLFSEQLLYLERERRPRSSLFDQPCFVSQIPTIVGQMIRYIYNEEQLVSFCANKALLSLLKCYPVKSEWVAQILTSITPLSLSSHGALYCLQAVTEILKMLRKCVQFNEGVQKQSFFNVLRVEWTRMLHFLLCCEVVTHDQCNVGSKWIELFHKEFLSHTAEILRHRSSPSESKLLSDDMNFCSDCCIAASQQVVVENLPILISLVAQRKYTSPQYLVIKVSSVFSIFLKVIDGDHFIRKHDCLDVALCSVFNMVELKAITKFWIQQHCSDLLQYNKEVWSPDVKFIEEDRGCCIISTLMRKMVLFILKYVVATSSTANSAGSCNLEQFFPNISPSLCNIWISDRSMIGLARSAALDLLVEQDDCLVEALLACCALHILRVKSGHCSALMHSFLTVFNIHAMTAGFLSSIHYDHSILLDLFISEETCFREFIVKYLRIVTRNWDDLKNACWELDSIYQKSDVMNESCAAMDSDVSILGKRKVDKCITEAYDCPIDWPRRKLSVEEVNVHQRNKISSRSEDPGELVEQETQSSTAGELVEQESQSSTDEEIDDVALSDSHTQYSETCLDKVVDCLTKLRFSLSRTTHCSTSFPATKEAIELLEVVEDMHEQQS